MPAIGLLLYLIIKLFNISLTDIRLTSGEFETKDYFYNKFSREVGDPTFYDKIVQHQMDDIIVATFRNKKLPRDTLQISIPFTEKDIYTVANVTYFDNCADGHVDSVFIGVKGVNVKSQADAIALNIELPDFRDFYPCTDLY